MVKSLEQYLSDLNFAPPEKSDGINNLNAAERAFVEKYMGLDALETLPRIDPEPLPETPVASPALRLRLAEPKKTLPEIVVAPIRPEAPAQEDEKVEQAQIVIAPAPDKNAIGLQTDSAMESARESLTEEIPESAPPMAENADRASVTLKPASPPPPTAIGIKASTAQAPVELSLKESMRKQSEVQMVSFFIGGQLFLLPVEGIQEVLRHMELIRVPQAPPFVAGVINLRGKVTPLVHLSAILTNMTETEYDPEKNFIIICGTEPLQIGLIIDRINSMHLLPQDKIIWNPESKLGEAADFLYAIVNLDEKVCGMVAPELITKKILSSDS